MRPAGPWTATIAPVLSVLVMTTAAAFGVIQFDVVLGPAPAWLPTAVLLGILTVALAGIGYGLVLRAGGSPVYARIGLGPQAALAVPIPRYAPSHLADPAGARTGATR